MLALGAGYAAAGLAVVVLLCLLLVRLLLSFSFSACFLGSQLFTELRVEWLACCVGLGLVIAIG
jgi:hypothetical protein